jgi:hypothetical protein
LKTLPGSTATKPAITKPAVISFQSICQSPRKLWATSDHACTEVIRPRHEPACEAIVWTWPVSASCACLRASSSSRPEMSARTAAHISRMSRKPPTNSAAVNSGPRKIQSTIPSSKTRLVEANMKAIVAGSPAPFWKVDLPIAIAA